MPTTSNTRIEDWNTLLLGGMWSIGIGSQSSLVNKEDHEDQE